MVKSLERQESDNSLSWAAAAGCISPWSPATGDGGWWPLWDGSADETVKLVNLQRVGEPWVGSITCIGK